MAADAHGGGWRKPAGGIEAVTITPVSNVAKVCFSTDGRECLSLELHVPTLTVELPLSDNGSSYDQSSSSMERIVSITHSLTAVMPANEAEAMFDPAWTARAAGEGVVAVVTAESGERLLAGWSEFFGAEQPLRLLGLSVSSGAKPADKPIAEALFRCESTSPAARIIAAESHASSPPPDREL